MSYLVALLLFFFAQARIPGPGGAMAVPPIALVTGAHTAKTQFGGNVTTSNIDTTGVVLLWACAEGFSYTPGSGTTGPISDNKSNTWHFLTNRSDGANGQTQIAYSYNPTVGSGHNFTLTAPTSGHGLAVMGFSGTLTSGDPFDTENGATSASSASIATGNRTPSQTGELVTSCRGSFSSTITGLAVTTVSIVDTANTSSAASSAYLVDSNTSPVGATWSTTSALDVSVQLTLFKHP